MVPMVPVVFISSTSDDLKDHRDQAARAAHASGFHPDMMEYFPAEGHRNSLEACRNRVEEAELVVVLVAHRYGWVPDDPSNPDAKSITWLECEHAWAKGKEVLAFLVDPDYDWPARLREDYRLVESKGLPRADRDRIADEVDRNERKLTEFKNKLSEKVRAKFKEAHTVRALVSEALADWKQRHPTVSITAPGDPENYLAWLEDDTRHIRIQALKTSRREPYVFPIDEIYIPLMTQAPGERVATAVPEDRRIAVERALAQRNIVLIGEPGAGKSTFLRRTAFELCRRLRGTVPPGTAPFLLPDDKRLPILIRAADLSKLLSDPNSARPDDSPDWIPHYLGRRAQEFNWNLPESFFRKRLDEGNCLVMIDGLDEAPERRLRERMARLFEAATRAFRNCDFLVSTRPQPYFGKSVLAGFQTVRIGDLEPPEITVFFDHFAKALALTTDESSKFQAALEDALQSRPEISEMARNPVMLTALAVLQHNDRRLPEYRVQLYESILEWLAAAREDMPGRPPAEKCLEYLRKLALQMQDAPEGRVVQINKRLAAELAAGEFGNTIEANEELLDQETQRSGILTEVGADLKFWHLSFQEYLAAREIAGLSERDQVRRIVQSGKLFQSEWREVMRLLGGLLRLQGEAKIEALIRAILANQGQNPPLPDQARCTALLGAMMRDLKPMGYTPATPDYERTIKSVMRIFDPEAADAIDFKTRLEAADALGQVGDPRLDEDNWITIPACRFWMGAQSKNPSNENYDPEANDVESPVHPVTLRAFRMARYPVTVQEFHEFIRAGGYFEPSLWPAGVGKFDEPEDWKSQLEFRNRPVVGVSWFEAAAYCSWKGGRLPSEAEWERAARGPNGNRYPWGDHRIDPSRANSDMNVGHPTPVGLYPRGNSPEEIADLIGDVWEWCADWCSPYTPVEQDNPTGPQHGGEKILRGGSWSLSPRLTRASYRNWGLPTLRSFSVGFRCRGEFR